jgi:hypothetical protein
MSLFATLLLSFIGTFGPAFALFLLALARITRAPG